MNYLREVAVRIRHEVPPDQLPEADPTLLFDLYAALALSTGTRTTGREVHDAWVVWMLAQGESHPAMVPYDELEAGIQAADEPFAEAIRRVAAEVVGGSLDGPFVAGHRDRHR